MRASWEGWVVEKVRFVMVGKLRRIGETRKDILLAFKEMRQEGVGEFAEWYNDRGSATVFRMLLMLREGIGVRCEGKRRFANDRFSSKCRAQRKLRRETRGWNCSH
jgi:hypothetical protein